MRVLVLATDELKEELAAFPFNADLEIEWLSDPGQYKGHLPPDACLDLLFDSTIARITWLKELRSPLIVVSSMIQTVAEIGEDFVRINGWHSFLKRPVVEAAVGHEQLKPAAEELFSFLGRSTEWVPDVPGFVTARIVSAIINEAFFALEQGVSSEHEIDTAMVLGTNYPFGPFVWSQIIGLKNVHLLLLVLEKQQSRYLPSSLLIQRALA
ncbi:MAG TPA: 3-hydroxyacyl-CoA dehydrogenase family protein [Chitinophagaceae bacterium]|nr:3-hydroxyacyl-CoA dehydrogenase family protein [Chitinophagaceae bacterium]